MAYSIDKKTGRITFGNFAKGIAPSPHSNTAGAADMKGVNISSIPDEVSVAYNRVRLDQAAVTGGTFTVNGGTPTTFAYSGVLTVGTWIKVNSHTGTPGTTDGHYYYASPIISGVSYNLYSDFGTTLITAGGSGTINFDTLTMGTPIDYTYETHSVGATTYRYYILDQNGVIWVSGTSGSAGTAAVLSTTTTWAAITPFGTTTNANVGTFNTNEGSIAIMSATDSNNKVSADYLMVFTQSQILYGKNSDNSGWPSVTGANFTVWQALNYTGGYSHHAFLGNDQIIYFCDGPGVGIIQQKSGQQFNPASSTTYNYVNANYLMAPNDAANRIATIPSGNGLSIVVGGVLNNLYIYPTYQNSTASGAAPTTLLWMPEGNTQYLLQTNNYVIIFAGNKGNIYLTNGSSVVPLLTVPDYISGSSNFTTTPASGNFVQDPYFMWGGAAYIRGRVFFSIKDQTASHTGNCGGIWSFVPSFSYYPNQDSGLSLRMEGASSQYATHFFNGYAPVLFAGAEISSQQANGPQYVAAWAQTTGTTTTNSIDFSGTSPLTNGSAIIETEAVPIGTFLEPHTYSQIEAKFSAALVTGESMVVYYRTDLEAAWVSAGTVTSESLGNGNGSPLSKLITPLSFQNVQLLQLQAVLTSTASSPSWCRLKEISII